jgi:NADPH2:quinone reductase
MAKMTKAIRIHNTGGPEVLKWEDITIGELGHDEVHLKHTAIGLNFIDCYQRSGLYPVELPMNLGTEAAGIVDAVGKNVTDLKIGERVAYAGGQIGSYCEARNISSNVLVKIPDTISDQTAAAMMLKGMTAHMLMFKCYKVKAGDTILIHAAAGGVGSIMCQWANALGATVIGTVSSTEKADKAKANGCHYPINYSTVDFAAKVKEITHGEGIPVVYESVGKDTYKKSMECLSNFGTLVNFGNASGPIPAIEPLDLMRGGSLSLSRPTLFNYTEDPKIRKTAAKDLFDVVASGKVKIEIGQTFPLSETAKAHTALESRQTMGSTVLIP